MYLLSKGFSKYYLNNPIILCVLILILASILRFYHLNHKSLWVDEIIATYIAAGTDLKADNSDFSYIYQQRIKDVSPPLRDYIAHFSFRIFGVNEIGLRFFPALFGILGVLLIYIAGSYFVNKNAGIFMALLLTVSPFHLHHSQDGRMYTLFMFFSLAGFFCIYRAMHDSAHRLYYWIGFILFNTLNIYLTYFGFWCLITQLGLGLLFICMTTKLESGKYSFPSFSGFFPLGMSLLLILILYLPWIKAIYTFLAQHIHAPVPYNLPFVSGEPDPETRRNFIYYFHLDWNFIKGMIYDFGLPGWKGFFYLLLFGNGLFYFYKKNRNLFWAIVVWIFIPILILVAPPGKALFFNRYISFIMPIYILGIGTGFYSWTLQIKTLCPALVKNEHILYMGMILVIVLFSYSPINDYYQTEIQNWKGAVRDIIPQIDHNDLIITGPYNAFWCTLYYLQQNGAQRGPLRPGKYGGEWTEVKMNGKKFYLIQKIQTEDNLEKYCLYNPQVWYITAYYRIYQYRNPSYYRYIEENFPLHKQFKSGTRDNDIHIFFRPK